MSVAQAPPVAQPLSSSRVFPMILAFVFFPSGSTRQQFFRLLSGIHLKPVKKRPFLSLQAHGVGSSGLHIWPVDKLVCYSRLHFEMLLHTTVLKSHEPGP